MIAKKMFLTQLATRLGLLLAAVLVAAMPGCHSWFPDSSGFIYMAFKDDPQNDGRLMHYDVNKKRLRTIARNVPAITVWPALSPDGKQVAVAAALDGRKRLPMQVIIYDLEGKELRRSPDFAWPRESLGAQPGPNPNGFKTGAFWVGGRIIVHDFEYIHWPDGNTIPTSTTGIYDLKKNTMITLAGRPAAFGGTPVLPNGKGFLITKPLAVKNARMVVSLVDWQGLVQDIAEIPGTSLVVDPWVGTSRWVGNTAEVTSGRVRFQIDTDKRTFTETAIPDSQARVNGADILQQYAFSNSKVQVRILNSGNDSRLELLKADEPTVLARFEKSPCHLSASPDGKRLAILVPNRNTDKGNEMIVVDHMGQVERFMAMPKE